MILARGPRHHLDSPLEQHRGIARIHRHEHHRVTSSAMAFSLQSQSSACSSTAGRLKSSCLSFSAACTTCSRLVLRKRYMFWSRWVLAGFPSTSGRGTLRAETWCQQLLGASPSLGASLFIFFLLFRQVYRE